MYRKMLEAANEIYADYISSGENVMNVGKLPTLVKLKDIIENVHKEDFGICENQNTNALLFGDKQTISYANIHSEQDERFSFGLFFIPKGGFLPLHDHHNMFVFSKILMGKVKRLSFQLINQSIQFEYPHQIFLQNLIIHQKQLIQLQQQQQQIWNQEMNNLYGQGELTSYIYPQNFQSLGQSNYEQQNENTQSIQNRLNLYQNEQQKQINSANESLPASIPNQNNFRKKKPSHKLDQIKGDKKKQDDHKQKLKGQHHTIKSTENIESQNGKLEQDNKYKVNNFTQLVEAKVDSEDILSQGFIDELDPQHKNLHYIEAMEDCVFFDVLLPHYDLKERNCNYYSICEGPDPLTGKTILQISNQPINQCKVQYFSIQKQTCPYFN